MAPVRKKQRLSNGSGAAVDRGVEDVASETPDSKPEQQRRSLFVRSLSANTTSQTLTDLFSDSYPVKHATAVIDPATKQCRGYGFVTFADTEDAQRAKEEFNGYALDGRRLRIEIAEPRHRDSDGDQADGPGVAKPGKKQQDLPQASRLIVRNLPWTIKTSEQLAKLFISYGKIKQAYIPKKGPGLLAGFGFVVLRGRKNAEKALEGINGKEIDGRTLAVDWAVSKDVYNDLLHKDGEPEAEGQDGEHTSESNVKADAGSKIQDFDNQLHASDDDGDIDEEGSEDGEDSAEDDEDGNEDIKAQMGEDESYDKSEDRSSTLFVRNLPFTSTDEDLEDHFSTFGSVRYARVVMDQGTERSKGTGFVCFYDKANADGCLRNAPKRTIPSTTDDPKEAKTVQKSNSLLQNEEADPSGQYTMDGRVLQVSRAVNKSEADRLTQEGAALRYKRNEDKRRLYLLSEGTISPKSKLWEMLSPSERTMREASAKQRKALIESNPSLHLSLTRLSIRNIPRSIGSKELKALAREAVVGFATDVKAGTREKLSKEELARAREEMQAAESARKKAGKGVVKQAKVVFEGAGGSKVQEDSGAGRSRGYGFIEYYTHRSAIMGLRWLNGHAVGYQVKDGKKAKASKEEIQERKKRLIVEFAIENAQVVMRRRDREDKARDRSDVVRKGLVADSNANEKPADSRGSSMPSSGKRKRGAERTTQLSSQKTKKRSDKVPASKEANTEKSTGHPKKQIDEKTARRNQIIGRKRAMRRARKGGKP